MIDLRCGDARAVLATLPDACCDALISDPPAGVSFMGKGWDGHKGGRDQWIAWLAGIMAEARRIIKPGGYALVWALPRTSHWTATALEDSGWRIIDIITHHFGQGFPKGKGQLKPASEHWILCRAPGALQPLQIDACRLPKSTDDPNRRDHPGRILRLNQVYGPESRSARAPTLQQGRWPPNTLFSHHQECQPTGVRRVPADKRGQGRPRGTFPHSDDAWGNGHRAYTGAETAGDGTEAQQDYVCVEQCPIRVLDEQAGPRPSGGTPFRRAGMGYHGADGQEAVNGNHGDTGRASRFFPTFPGPDPEDAVPFRYQPKAPPSERRLADGTPTGHPTQKPVALAQWLASLVCAPGGTILDPFAGVGSLGVGALRAGCHYLGIEQDAGYAAVAQRRLDEEQEQRSGPLFAGVRTATSAAR